MTHPKLPIQPYAPFKPQPPDKTVSVEVPICEKVVDMYNDFNLNSFAQYIKENCADVDVEDVHFKFFIDNYGEYVCIIFFLTETKNAPNYDKSLAHYEKSMVKYEKEYRKYKKELEEYKVLKKEYDAKMEEFELEKAKKTIKKLEATIRNAEAKKAKLTEVIRK